MSSAPTHTLAARAVGALRDALADLDKAVALCQEMQTEAVALVAARDIAIEDRGNAERLFDSACTERDNALGELSSVKASLADLAKRSTNADKVIERLEREIALRDSVISLAGATPHEWQAARAAHNMPKES